MVEHVYILPKVLVLKLGLWRISVIHGINLCKEVVIIPKLHY